MAYRALLLGRNDGNGPLDEGRSLQWCCRYEPDSGDPDGLGECDVRRMRDALQLPEATRPFGSSDPSIPPKARSSI
jgi:hypothetical protein